MADLVALKAFNTMLTGDKTQQYLKSVLGERKNSFVNNLVALVANNTNLQKCEPYSLMYAAMKATALDLPLDNNLGFAFIIPYGNSAQFQMGWRGYQQLALRTNQFKIINTTDIREGEIKHINYLTGQYDFQFEQDKVKRDKLPIIGYCNFFMLKNGFESTLYMSVEDLTAHGKKYSKTYSRADSKWKTDFSAMAKKTVVKLNLNRNAPLSAELRDAIAADQSIIHDNDKYEYVDVVEEEINEEKQKAVQDKFADFEEKVAE